jgi:predicted ester cyclase
MFGSDDRVVVRFTLHATHTGPFAGLSPTHKKAVVRGISLYGLNNGKITETRKLADLLGLFTQLGTIEQRKSAAAQMHESLVRKLNLKI